MGTNYYAHDISSVCPTCNHNTSTRKHIGKSSSGWTFGLHTIPEDNLTSLDTWLLFLESSNIVIRDECDNILTIEALHNIITKRQGREAISSERQALMRDTIPGPNNLIRSIIDGVHCVGHGAGTWDMIAGEFS